MFRQRILPIAIACLLLIACTLPALAHPLDEYLQATYITFEPDRIGVELDLTPGVVVAPDLLKQIDLDGDQQLSPAEQSHYINEVVQALVLQVDQQPQTLTLLTYQFPAWLELSAGAGTIRLHLVAEISKLEAGSHQLFFENKHKPLKSSYQVNALLPKVETVQIDKQQRNETQQNTQIDYTLTAAQPAANSVSPNSVSQAEASLLTSQQQLLSYLNAPILSPWMIAIALGISILLGGLHALTPGHGKTLVAAYLIGSRGTVKHAVWLGGIVTFTHTASVIAFGLLALLASQLILPNVLLPILEIGSGLLVLGLGLRLIWQRWQGLQSDSHDHSPDHDHSDHDHPHDHTHDHDHHHHHHHVPEQVKIGDLLAMGISGGLVPCPEALSILLVAIGINRIALGLGLIVSFSLGLAGVLIAIGVLLVRSQGVMARVSNLGGNWQKWLPLASAVIVTLLGMGIVAKGLM